MKSLLQLVFHVLSLEKPARTVGIDVILYSIIGIKSNNILILKLLLESQL